MVSGWLLPAAVLVGSVFIALAIAAPTVLALREDAGTKAKHECESLIREGFPDSSAAEKLVLVCIRHRAGL
jgi:hypothetical protein